jgi:hypothetical protein
VTHRPESTKPDTVQRSLWFLTLLAIVILWVGRGRLGVWEKTAQLFLGVCLVGMGAWQFRRLVEHGWWKGDWRTTWRRQRHEEAMAVLVAFNVMLIGAVCFWAVLINLSS